MASERYQAGKFGSGDKSVYLHTTGQMTKLGTETHLELMVLMLKQWYSREGRKEAQQKLEISLIWI